MTEKCKALMRYEPLRYRKLRRVYNSIYVNGHEFRREYDWRCESCNEQLAPHLREAALLHGDLGDAVLTVLPCIDPQPSDLD